MKSLDNRRILVQNYKKKQKKTVQNVVGFLSKNVVALSLFQML